MRGKRMAIAVASFGALALARNAAAQVPSEPRRPSGADTAGFAEVGLGLGLVAGSGAGSTYGTTRVQTPGIGGAIELDAGWRVLPELAVGVWGFGSRLSEAATPPSPADAYTAGAGIQGTWHFRPDAPDFDPWLMVGSGWKARWLDFRSDGVTAEHGMDVARLQVGVDLRLSATVALGPMIGASLSTYLLEATAGGPWHAIRAPRFDAFGVAGVRGTFDVAPRRTPPPVSARAW
jgi:hypothetical protein